MKRLRQFPPNLPTGPQDWDSLRAFLFVARERSITKAAAKLNTQHSTVSRRIKALQEKMGRPLAKIGQRGVRLTPDGIQLYEVLERFAEELDAVNNWIVRGPQGAIRPMTVHISCPEGLSAFWLTRFLPAMQSAKANVCFNVSTQTVVTVEQCAPYDLIVQMFRPPGIEHAKQIGTVHFRAMASADYLARHGTYQRGVSDPTDHRWIEHVSFGQMNGSWETWFQKERANVVPAVVTNSLVTVVNAVLAGSGIGVLPTYFPIIFPELEIVPSGLELQFEVWQIENQSRKDSPEAAEARNLIAAAIEPAAMPWFRDTHSAVQKIYEQWRVVDEYVRREVALRHGDKRFAVTSE